MGNDLIDQAVFFCLLCGHIVIALGIQLDLFQRLTDVYKRQLHSAHAEVETHSEVYTPLIMPIISGNAKVKMLSRPYSFATTHITPVSYTHLSAHHSDLAGWQRAV